MIERQTIGKGNEAERAILVGVCSRDMTFEQAKEYLDELAFLTETAGGKAVRSFIQKLDKPINSTYIGSGKVLEVKEAVEEAEADMVIFDDDLSPSQIRNLDKILEVKVLDRSSLILHIFSERAQTAQARTQVDLAQYQYLLPRLTGMWTHLSRQKGGIGLKGAGEKEIETDRRIIRQKIAALKDQLEKIDRQDATRRKNRGEFVRVALVGYTNVGKSTLMNIISKSQVLAENKLFATLDTTVRKVAIHGIPFLLSDTVGFIRKLPTHLVESFKSTLAETRESDVILHVVDASHPQFEDHIQTVKETLRDLNIKDRPVITVFNKIDQLEEDFLAQLQQSWYADENAPAVFISAQNKINLDDLRQAITEELVKGYNQKSHHGQHHFLATYQYYQLSEENE
ncbi:MAG: GTPase HflX [Bacteroidota bacterium]